MTTEAQIGQETPNDIRKSLSCRALECARYGYESACRDRRDLEAKLRGLAGISGISIGGIAALAGNHRIGALARILLFALVVVLAIIALALGVVFTLRGLRIRDHEVPPPAREFLEDAIVMSGDPADDLPCLRARAREWTAKATMQYAVSEESIRRVNDSKAEQVSRAETCLLIGACLGAVVLVAVAGGPLLADPHSSGQATCVTSHLDSTRTNHRSHASPRIRHDVSRAHASSE